MSTKTKKSLHNIIEKTPDLGLEYFIQVPTLLFINCENLHKEFNLSKLFNFYLKLGAGGGLYLTCRVVIVIKWKST